MGFRVDCYDTLIKNGHIYDPERGVDMIGHIGILEPNIATIIDPDHIPGKICAHRVIDATGYYVVPGLIDGHAHVVDGAWFNFPPERMFERGITSCIDLGSVSWPGFNRNRKKCINDFPATIQAALMLTINAEIGCAAELWADVDAEVNIERLKECFEINKDILLGIKILVGKNETPTPELIHRVFKKTREACDEIGCRMFAHIANPPIPASEWLSYFKPGDVVTHTYNKGNILDENGQVLPEVWEARKRGVIFDTGRGSRNWSVEMAKLAFEQGFYPQMITSDLSSLSNDPNTSRLNVHMAECMALGMDFKDVLYCVTDAPAAVMNNVTVGLKVGNRANISVLDLKEGEVEFVDAFGVKSKGNKQVLPVATIVNGKVMFDKTNTDY